MKILSATTTAALLPYEALAGTLARVMLDARAGRAVAPERTAHPLPEGGMLLLMPAWDERLGVLKRVSVHPANPERGLAQVQAEVLVFDVHTGEAKLLLDGAVVTARRTAALSLLAVQRLAAKPPEQVLVLGAGTQARAHLEALSTLRPGRVFVYNRTFSRAAELAAHGRKLGLAMQTVPFPDKVAPEVDLIVSATSSAAPVVPEEVADDALIVAVGAFTPRMAELPAALVKRSQVFVDTLPGARAEAGDLLQAGVDWAQVRTLGEALEEGPPAGGPVVFKSVGSALWDLAAARLIYGT